ncbi:MAG: hypothetical protein O9310_09165 [Leptospiraceae bacterium]|nr:hypothetical protein [Leptospiraceae bacterium]
MDLLEQHKEMMEVLNKIEENTKETKEVVLAMANGMNRIINKTVDQKDWNPIDLSKVSNKETSEAIQETEPANEPEGQTQAS